MEHRPLSDILNDYFLQVAPDADPVARAAAVEALTDAATRDERLDQAMVEHHAAALAASTHDQQQPGDLFQDARPLSLAEAAARWRHAPPATRLRYRGRLLRLIATLEPARDRALNLDRVLDRARNLDLDLDLDRIGALDFELDIASDRALNIASTLDHARNPASDRDDLTRALDLDTAVDHALDLAITLDRASDLASDLASLFEDLDSNLDSLLDDLDSARNHNRDLALDLASAHDNLSAAANDFVGTDLTNTNLEQLNLSGLRWDQRTRWPTPEWTNRMRRASAEHPPGSGIYVVLPEWHDAPAEAVPV